jgi:hypothetical protein
MTRDAIPPLRRDPPARAKEPQMSTAATRPATRRPDRAPAPPLPAMDALDRTHREMMSRLDDLDALLRHLDRKRPANTC